MTSSNLKLRSMRAGLVKLSPFAKVFLPAISSSLIDSLVICDISGWQGDADHGVNFTTMKAAGASAVYIKATQGVSHIDDQFAISRAGADGTLPWGVYHFLSTQSGITQANHLLTATGGRTGVLPIALDVELPSVSSQVVKDFCQRIVERVGVLPLVYTSINFWGKVYGAIAKRWVSDNCGLWAAHWGTDTPSLPNGWTTYVIHQYSAKGVGVEYGAPPPPYADDDIDLNRCRGDWLAAYTQPILVTLEERVGRLEDAARVHGWDV